MASAKTVKSAKSETALPVAVDLDTMRTVLEKMLAERQTGDLAPSGAGVKIVKQVEATIDAAGKLSSSGKSMVHGHLSVQNVATTTTGKPIRMEINFLSKIDK